MINSNNNDFKGMKYEPQHHKKIFYMKPMFFLQFVRCLHQNYKERQNYQNIFKNEYII